MLYENKHSVLTTFNKAFSCCMKQSKVDSPYDFFCKTLRNYMDQVPTYIDYNNGIAPMKPLQILQKYHEQSTLVSPACWTALNISKHLSMFSKSVQALLKVPYSC